MNLREFKARIDFLFATTRDPDSIKVCITTADSSVGGRAYTEIERIDLGFDWEHNQIRIEPVDKIVKVK